MWSSCFIERQRVRILVSMRISTRPHNPTPHVGSTGVSLRAPRTTSSLCTQHSVLIIRLLFLPKLRAAVCLFLLSVPAHAVQPYTPVQPDPFLEPWRWRSFPELSGKGLKCLAEDGDGNVWFGLRDGVERYDGKTWTFYTERDGLLGSPVSALHSAEDGRLYAGTPQGISVFSQGSWSRLFPKEGAFDWHIADLLEASDGALWAATSYGALRLQAGEALLYTSAADSAALTSLVSGVVFRSIPSERIPRREWGEGTGIRLPRTIRGDPRVILELSPSGPGHAAGLVVGDRIVSVNGQRDQPESLLDGPPGTDVRVTVSRRGVDVDSSLVAALSSSPLEGTYADIALGAVFEDRSGSLWFGLVQGEILRLGVRGDQMSWGLFTAENGLDVGLRPRIDQAPDGAIWVVADNIHNGISRLLGDRWEVVRQPGGGDANINPSILTTGGDTVLVGGYQGHLLAYRDGDWTIYRAPDIPIPTARIVSLVRSGDGSLWMAGLNEDVVRVDLGSSRWTTYEGLNYESTGSDGVVWYVTEDDGVVAETGQGWARYGMEDGLMEFPHRVFVTENGSVWAAGSHQGSAATARFSGRDWALQTYPQLSWGIDPRAVFESSDGDLWLGAMVDLVEPNGQRGGILRFSASTNTLIHYQPPGPLGSVYGIGEDVHGSIWMGGDGLRKFDGTAWSQPTDLPDMLPTTRTDEIATSAERHLWIGTRTEGAWQFDGTTWTQHDVEKGLPGNRIQSILPTADGSVWVVSRFRGVSRFDGKTWTRNVLSRPLILSGDGRLRQSPNGAIWANSRPLSWTRRARPGFDPKGTRRSVFQTVRYVPDRRPPDTRIVLAMEEVSHLGNATIRWDGSDPWRRTPTERLRFSWRVDNGSWSPFRRSRNHTFQELGVGSHRVDVRARDLDFNEDPTPAHVVFVVAPPVWGEPWFVGLMAILLGAIGYQSVRVVLRGKRVAEANSRLEQTNESLFALNRRLQEKTDDLEQANRQVSEANRWKSQFLESMSHELRTPLNAILGFTNLILRRPESLSERHQQNLGKVKQGGDYLLSLVGDILDLTDIEAGSIEVKVAPFDVATVIESCCETVSPLLQQNVEMDVDLPEDIGTVNGDQSRVRQILINLLGYTVKFTESGVITVGARKSDDAFSVFVSDTGLAIPSDQLATVFDEFRNVEGSGILHKDTGLGLSIAKRLCELMGGSVGVSSEMDEGTTFTVQLPLPTVREGESGRQQQSGTE